VAHDGTNVLVVWSDARSGGADIYAARVSGGGTVLDPSGIVVSGAAGAQTSPAVAVGGSQALVVWSDQRSGPTADVYGARMTSAGTTLDPSGIAVSTAPGEQIEPAVARDGSNYVVVWSDGRAVPGRDIFAARVSTAGAVLDPAGVALVAAPAIERRPAVAFGGTNHLVAWDDSRSGNLDVYATRVTTALAVLDPGGRAISVEPFEEREPAVAWDGTVWLVAWSDGRGDGNEIYGSRVAPNGMPLDPAGIPIAARPGDSYEPSAAAGGAVFVVPGTEATP
jgi:hypothetical protein